MSSLADLKARLGIVGTKDDPLLQQALDAGTGIALQGLIASAVDPSTRPAPVDEAILMYASRWYRRRLTPEGVAGWADIGAIRISSRDPDVDTLLEPYRDMTQAGLA